MKPPVSPATSRVVPGAWDHLVASNGDHPGPTNRRCRHPLHPSCGPRHVRRRRTTGSIFMKRTARRAAHSAACRVLQRLARTAEIPAAADISRAVLAMPSQRSRSTRACRFETCRTRWPCDPRTTQRHDSVDGHAICAVATNATAARRVSTRCICCRGHWASVGRGRSGRRRVRGGRCG